MSGGKKGKQQAPSGAKPGRAPGNLPPPKAAGKFGKRKEKKRKEIVAAEAVPPAPPAKRAAGSGRRLITQSTAVYRKRQEVSFDLFIYAMIWLHNYDTFI